MPGVLYVLLNTFWLKSPGLFSASNQISQGQDASQGQLGSLLDITNVKGAQPLISVTLKVPLSLVYWA